jgi:hypothetical protein
LFNAFLGLLAESHRASGGYGAVARCTVKVAAIVELDSLKASGNAIDANVLVAIVVCLTVRLRKFNVASHAAFWAAETFGPLIASGHPANMRRKR